MTLNINTLFENSGDAVAQWLLMRALVCAGTIPIPLLA